MRYFVEINNSDGRYYGGIYRDNHLPVLELPQLKLGPDASLIIRGRNHTLSEVLERSITKEELTLPTIFDERGQVELGQYLYHQVFGGLDAASLRGLQDEPVEVLIVTNDEHIARLPWALLSSNGVFRSTTGWSVALSSGQLAGDCELPPSPNLLFIMPEAAGCSPTGARHHLEGLEDVLSRANHRHSQGLNLKVVRTWEQFTESTGSFHPHVVYFYGHGDGDLSRSSLIFETGSTRQFVDKSVLDVGNCLRHVKGETPRLAFINCCLGDAGGLLGVGFQLRDFIPAVITNCTLAHVPTAQAQAEALFRSILIDGEPPHAAIAGMRRNLSRLNLSFRDMRWMTPVLHCQYRTWTAHPPRPSSHLFRDQNWRYKLDRIVQTGRVVLEAWAMLTERKPRSFAYIWYGRERQGVELFHRRLVIELREKLSQAYLYEVTPEWPNEVSNFGRSMTDMMTAAFGVQDLSEIPDRIRTQSGGVTDRIMLVYVRHETVRDSKRINIDFMKRYLEWWNEKVAMLLGDQTFTLLGIPYIVGKPEAFGAALEKKGLRSTNFNHTRVRVLEELGSLHRHDLTEFIQTKNIAVPGDFDYRLLDQIIAECRGEYEPILERLKDIDHHVWTRLKAEIEEDEDFDEDLATGGVI